MLGAKDRMTIATVVNTLKTIAVQDGNDNNLSKMAVCINTLTNLIKEVGPGENNAEQDNGT